MKITTHTTYTIIFCFIFFATSYSQKKVSITIDDVPNTRLYEEENFSPVFLKKLDSLNIPVAIFINEGKLNYKDGFIRHEKLLKNWLDNDFVTAGNHTYSHLRYSTSNIDTFKKDIIKGEYISRKLAEGLNKNLKYFRFPYNDLGADSISHTEINEFLISKGYILTPFTIESADWMFNRVYTHFIKEKNFDKAEEIGQMYVELTIQLFEYFEKFSEEYYGRQINHIYLCHDNLINSEYLEKIVHRLTLMDYNFVSLDEALTDEIYSSKDNYFRKWGISWIYRWMETQEERIKYMRMEPPAEEIEKLYGEIFQ